MHVRPHALTKRTSISGNSPTQSILEKSFLRRAAHVFALRFFVSHRRRQARGMRQLWYIAISKTLHATQSTLELSCVKRHVRVTIILLSLSGPLSETNISVKTLIFLGNVHKADTQNKERKLVASCLSSYSHDISKELRIAVIDCGFTNDLSRKNKEFYYTCILNALTPFDVNAPREIPTSSCNA